MLTLFEVLLETVIPLSFSVLEVLLCSRFFCAGGCSVPEAVLCYLMTRIPADLFILCWCVLTGYCAYGLCPSSLCSLDHPSCVSSFFIVPSSRSGLKFVCHVISRSIVCYNASFRNPGHRGRGRSSIRSNLVGLVVEGWGVQDLNND